MNLQQFGQSIQQKYPAYATMDATKVGEQMLAKYPQYKSMITADAPVTTAGGYQVPQATLDRVAASGKPALLGAPTPAAPKTYQPDFIGDTQKSFDTRIGNVNESLDLQDAKKQGKDETFLQTAGQVAGAAGDLIGNTAKAAGKYIVNGGNGVKGIPQSTKDSVMKNINDVKNSAVGQAGLAAAQKGFAAYSIWRHNNLSQAKNLEAIVNIASILPVGVAGEEGAKVAGSVAKDIGVSALDTGKGLVEGAKNLPSEVGTALAKRSPEQAAQLAEDTTRQIIQPKNIADIKPAAKTLKTLDISGVKTYSDLKNVIDTQIKNVSENLDKSLGAKKTATTLDKLAVGTKVGDQTVSHNYVKDALDQLKSFYNKTNDVEGETKIAQMESKASTKGLTVKEINDLAKEHGRVLNGYNANGELANGLSKQAAENTRAGLKGTARNLFGKDSYKAADSQLSSLMRTKDLVANLEEKVSQLKGKIQPRNLGQKVGYGLGKAINFAGGGAPKEFIQSFFPRGQGLKTLNAIDLEKALVKNLTRLQKL